MSVAQGSRALVILSGGQDSATCLFWAAKRFERLTCITFDYGQRHRVELECAQRLAQSVNAPWALIPINSLSALSDNALTSNKIGVNEASSFNGLPATFVPGRNAIFLTLAAAHAAPQGIHDLVLGACETDFSGYPDCRDSFLASMETSLTKAMDFEMRIHRPLMWLDKAQTFALADELGVLDRVVRETHTCYEGDHKSLHAWGYGCNNCQACELRRKGYEEFLSRSASWTKGPDRGPFP